VTVSRQYFGFSRLERSGIERGRNAARDLVFSGTLEEIVKNRELAAPVRSSFDLGYVNEITDSLVDIFLCSPYADGILDLSPQLAEPVIRARLAAFSRRLIRLGWSDSEVIHPARLFNNLFPEFRS
jgi:hypothetical protein